MTVLLISGSRNASVMMKAYAHGAVERANCRHYSIIVGDAHGIDRVVALACTKYNVECTIFGTRNTIRNLPRLKHPMVDLVRGSFRSYTERDRFMVEQADMILCIWDGKSHGTKAVYDYAKSLGKTVWLRTFR